MEFLTVSWKAIKQFATERLLSIQYVEDGNNYHLIVFDKYFSLKTTLSKLVNIEEVTDFESNYKVTGNSKLEQPLTIGSIPPSAAKTIGNKKLFKRVKGLQMVTVPGLNNLIWTVDMNWAKLIGIEFINAQAGDKCSLVILDRIVNPIYGIPNQQLNQFGFDVNIAKDLYIHRSEFDADLYLDLQIKLIYTSTNNNTVGVNFIMNEVV